MNMNIQLIFGCQHFCHIIDHTICDKCNGINDCMDYDINTKKISIGGSCDKCMQSYKCVYCKKNNFNHMCISCGKRLCFKCCENSGSKYAFKCPYCNSSKNFR